MQAADVIFLRHNLYIRVIHNTCKFNYTFFIIQHFHEMRSQSDKFALLIYFKYKYSFNLSGF